jgi:hypothetical protein
MMKMKETLDTDLAGYPANLKNINPNILTDTRSQGRQDYQTGYPDIPNKN